MVHTPNSKYKLLMPRPGRYTHTGTRTTTTRPIATLTETTLFPPLETSEDENEQANVRTATTTTTTRSTSTASTNTMLSPELRETFLTLQAIHREECRLLKRNNDEVDHHGHGHGHGHVSDNDDDDDDDDIDEGGRGEGKFRSPSSAKKKQKVSSHHININNIQGHKEVQGEEEVHDEEESKEDNITKVKHSSNDPKVEKVEEGEEEHDESIKSGELKARKFEAAVAATVAAESEICMLTSGIAELEAILLQQGQKDSVSNVVDDDDDGGVTLTLNVDDTQGEEEKNVDGGSNGSNGSGSSGGSDDGDWKHKAFPALPSVSASLSDTLTRGNTEIVETEEGS